MNTALNKVTKYMLIVIIGLSLSLVLSTSFINTAQPDIGDVNVTVDNTGKLKVDGGGMSYDNSQSAVNAFLTKYKTLVVAISGIGAISMIAFFIMNFLKLGSVATNPSERAKVLAGLVWSGIAAAGLGAVSLIVGFFYNSMK